MKRIALILALLPVPAAATQAITNELIAAMQIARTVDDRCDSIVFAGIPGAKPGSGTILSRKDMKEIRAEGKRLSMQFEKDHGVALQGSNASLCKAGEAEIKSGTAIGQLLKRK